MPPLMAKHPPGAINTGFKRACPLTTSAQYVMNVDRALPGAIRTITTLPITTMDSSRATSVCRLMSLMAPTRRISLLRRLARAWLKAALLATSSCQVAPYFTNQGSLLATALAGKELTEYYFSANVTNPLVVHHYYLHGLLLRWHQRSRGDQEPALRYLHAVGLCLT